jgi:hypothetical protein
VCICILLLGLSSLIVQEKVAVRRYVGCLIRFCSRIRVCIIYYANMNPLPISQMSMRLHPITRNQTIVNNQTGDYNCNNVRTDNLITLNYTNSPESSINTLRPRINL